MESWNRETLLHYAQDKQSENDISKLDRAISSIAETQMLCSYHYRTLHALLDEHMRNNPTESSLFRSRFSVDTEVNKKDFEFTLACRANIIAIVRTLHSCSDIVGFVIYLGLCLNHNDSTWITPSRVSLYNVKEKLKKFPESLELLSLLGQLTNNSDYKHLCRLSNQTKHSIIVRAQSHFNLKEKDKERYQFIFEEVETEPGGTEKFSETNAIPFIENEFKRQNDIVINILHCLDKLVSVAI
ncbi:MULTISPECIES: hypothetical protein [unclassified Pseudoalteromonas]|uniref:hypothetical protein n=1 Tax=unclassified Pseudoalteromonas TaxID=194690 RepID=UPI001601EC90|nr:MULTISPECIES: hypothetical protein [unclassified Pseudoalteromonas]MBB1410239.1 hypothetical protein [Pseudoalteromonas sp. SG44-17]MBB1471094.1 hypothetical protein [Pseudoalteromonas sp. SG41-5]